MFTWGSHLRHNVLPNQHKQYNSKSKPCQLAISYFRPLLSPFQCPYGLHQPSLVWPWRFRDPLHLWSRPSWSALQVRQCSFHFISKLYLFCPRTFSVPTLKNHSKRHLRAAQGASLVRLQVRFLCRFCDLPL